MYAIKSDIFHTIDHTDTLLITSILDSENCYYRSTGVSKDVFKKLLEKKDLESIIKELLTEYEVEEHTLRQDVTHFINFLLENKIVEKL
jgi:hypothetical protein